MCLGSGGREAPGISEPEPITFPRLYNIAHLHVDKGKTIREIVGDLKVSRNTVREELRVGGDVVRVRAGRGCLCRRAGG